MNLYVVVKDGQEKTYNHRFWLYNHQLRFKKTGRYKGAWFLITTNQNVIIEIQNYCKKNKLLFQFYDQNQKRSTTYRDVFYNHNPAIFGKYYICAYCLLPHKKENITVDHIISIKKSRTSKLCKWVIKKMAIENINDYKNLVAACPSCNSKKGAKGGLWIIRGFLGKHKMFIVICYLVLIVWLVMICMLMSEVLI